MADTEMRWRWFLDQAGATSWYSFGGTRRILYEGSGSGYMLCSCNDILHENKQTCTWTIVENSSSAGSYRGKILGAILAQIIFRAASLGMIGPYPVLNEDCDNNGIVLHGNSYTKPLPASQTQADVLRVMKKLISRQVFTIRFLYVWSHTDTIKKLSEYHRWWPSSTSSPPLIFIWRVLWRQFSNEDFIITMGGAKTTGPIRDALEQHWGRTEAQSVFHLKHIVYSQNFDLIWWDGVGKASSPSRYPGGADPIASNPYGTLRLVICAQTAELHVRHLNISPTARLLEGSSYSSRQLPT